MRRRRVSAVALSVLVASLVLMPIEAKALTTYDVQVGAFFFEQGVPGLSLRIYPTSITLHKGDVIHFKGFTPVLFPKNQHPQDFFEDKGWTVGDPYFDLVSDPDDGADALKFNDFFSEFDADCSSQASPCQWDAGTGDVINPKFAEIPEDFLTEGWVAVTANPGETLYAATSYNSLFRIKVVADNVAASTQAELDSRAASQVANDLDWAASTDKKLSTKQTFHKSAGGRRVWDVWQGADRGPVSLEQTYPRRLNLEKGDSVQFHFNLDWNVHTATLPKSESAEIIQGYGPGNPGGFADQCDTDGDQGSAPDVTPTFGDQGPVCPDGSVLEFDLNPAELNPSGNGVFTGANDFEHSGVKTFVGQSPGFYNQDPFTVRFNKGQKGGILFRCTIHPFMKGRIFVEN